MSFGSQIRDHLQAKGISQSVFAEELGISRGRLNNYLMGRSEPDYTLLKCIATKLEVSLDELLEIKPVSNTDTKGKNVEANFDIVVSPEPPSIEKGPYSWIPLYKTAASPSDYSASSLAPCAWIRVADRYSITLGGSRSYALLVKEESMAPVFLPGDIVFLRPQVSYLFLDGPEKDSYFSVRLDAADKIGLSLRRCDLQEDTLTLIPINPSERPTVFDLSQTGFVPMAGKVTSLTRIFSDLNFLVI